MQKVIEGLPEEVTFILRWKVEGGPAREGGTTSRLSVTLNSV